MVDRALNICDPKFLRSELAYIERTLMFNGYPSRLIRSVIKEAFNPSTPSTPDTDDRRPTIILPHHAGVDKKIKLLWKQLGFRVDFGVDRGAGFLRPGQRRLSYDHCTIALAMSASELLPQASRTNVTIEQVNFLWQRISDICDLIQETAALIHAYSVESERK
uniref:Helix-turn-helix domain-containing protein n=1 Tax=Trichuris muris TaxID=70415 RepID=A0A5S6Q7Q9_TRIMR